MFFLLTETAHVPHAQGSHGGGFHLSSWVQLLARSLEPSPVSDFLIRWEKSIYSFIIVGIISFAAFSVSRNRGRVPTRARIAVEGIVTMLDGLVCGVLGKQGRAYTPFIGTLFIYILVSNLFGLIPLQNSTMSVLTTTVPLAVSVFLYVQWIGISKNGLGGYLYHLAGSPKEIFGYVLVPLNLPLHVLGEFIKPLSLSFRLYGNVMAGHILLGVFVMLGIQALAPLHVPAGIPFHIPFLFLEIMVGLIQAFVFTLLSTVYIAMMLPHEEHAAEHAAH